MADFATHTMLGIAICPDHPVLGAIFGSLPDAPMIPMNVYTLLKYRRTATNHDWAMAPRWLTRTYHYMHGLFIPAAIMLYAWLFIPSIFPLLLAYCSHVLVDAWTHDETSILYPLVRTSLSGYGKDWWKDRKLTAGMIFCSAIFMIIRLGWL